MRKIKIFITLFALYELIMLTILQIPDYCSGVFNINFCNGSFKYFFMCIALPVAFGIFIWWVPDITRFFSRKCECLSEPQKDNTTIKNMISDIISKQDIERFITAAIIMGIQKFVVNHPKATEAFNNIMDVIKNTPTTKKKK